MTDEVLKAADTLVSAFGEGRLDDYFAAFAPDATFVFHHPRTPHLHRGLPRPVEQLGRRRRLPRPGLHVHRPAGPTPR
ncbi:hypothetical protein [Streptomyces sp. NBC_01750]|uniref:hypothetical protein n=1 Tax=Streptomyces sp. NBC_01750 TaxID=2975928 RepID=UPI002DDA6638|nr:hypothetical protein [Streptomyces sp. NBC_01750]WSD37139.1 hypothetical protein OG966_37685 [Streptomyces sp. NBC_01750]